MADCCWQGALAVNLLASLFSGLPSMVAILSIYLMSTHDYAWMTTLRTDIRLLFSGSRTYTGMDSSFLQNSAAPILSSNADIAVTTADLHSFRHPLASIFSFSSSSSFDWTIMCVSSFIEEEGLMLLCTLFSPFFVIFFRSL